MALSPLLMPQGIMAGMAGMTQQPTAMPTVQPMMPKPAAQSTSLDDLARALSGDFASSLSGGDRLMALSALMRSATRSGRQAGLTPQQVVGDLRQQQVQQIQSRMQIEQLRAAEAQRQQQMAASQQFAQTLEEPQRIAFLGLPLEQQMSRMEQEAFRPRQIVRTTHDADGRTINQYLNGDVGPAGFDLPPELEIDTYDANGDGVAERVVLNKVTREIISTHSLGETPNQISAGVRANRGLNLRERELNRPPSGGGGGSGRRNAPAEITDASGNRVIAQWDPQSQQYYRSGTNQVVNRGVNTSAGGLPNLPVVGGGTARFGGR